MDTKTNTDINANPFANITTDDRVKYAGLVVAIGMCEKRILCAAPTAAALQEMMKRDYRGTKYARVALPK